MIDESNNMQQADDSTPSQMPLGVGDGFGNDGGAMDPLAGAEAKSGINTGAVLIVVVIVIAAGGLFVMRTLAGMTSIASADSTTEQKIAAFLDVISGNSSGPRDEHSVLMNSDDTALQVLGESYTDRQVPLDNVQRNPFVIDETRTSIPTASNPNPDRNSAERAKQAMRDRFIKAGNGLSLDSTLLGSTPLANISGDIYRVGDVLYLEKEDVSLRITEIKSNSVRLLGEHHEYGLQVPIILKIDL